MKRNIWKKRLSAILAVAVVVTSMPLTAFAEDNIDYVQEQEILPEEIPDGAFYFASAGAEISESDNRVHRVLVKRRGDNLPDASVRVTMIDFSAEYGTDYTVHPEGGSLFNDGISNKEEKTTLEKYLSESEEIEEYNYSDAIIDGTVNAENQLSEDEEENYEFSEEDKEKIEAGFEAMSENIFGQNAAVEALSGTEAPESAAEEIEAVAEAVPEIEAETATEIEAMIATKSTADAETKETEKSSDVLTYSKNPIQADLSKIKEYATGIVDDREEPVTNYASGISTLDNLTSDSPGYMDDSIALLGSELSSAYFILDFAENETEKYIDITIKDNDTGTGDRLTTFNLFAENEEMISGMYGKFTLTILDDEEYETPSISFSQAEYHPNNGYITAVIERTGNISGISAVMIDTEDETALESVDYSKVHAQLLFSPGLKKRTVKIPVTSRHLTNDVSFKLKLQEYDNSEPGELTEATCIIHQDDTGFDVEKFYGIDMLGAADAEETGEEGTLLGASYGRSLDSVVLGTPLKLTKENLKSNYALGADSESGYYSNGNDGWGEGKPYWGIFLNHGTSGVEGMISFSYDVKNLEENVRIDINGFRIRHRKGKGGDDVDIRLGTPEFSVNRPNNACDFGNIWDFRQFFCDNWASNWGWRNDDYFFNKELGHDQRTILGSAGIGLWVEKTDDYRYGYYLFDEITPIKRLYQIELLESNPVQFYDKDGVKKNNTAIAGMTSENKTQLVNSIENQVIVTSGEDATIKLSDAAKNTYIKNVYLVSWDGSKSVALASNLPETTTQYSYKLNNNDLMRYSGYTVSWGIFVHNGRASYIDYVSNPNGNGTYGRFKLKVDLAPKTAMVKVANDNRATVTVTGATKDTTVDNTGAFTTYKCNKGDMLTYTVSNVTSGYDWNQLKIHRVASSLADTTVFREKGRNVAYAQVDAAETEVTPMITHTENKMIVKVKRSLYDDGKTFDKNSPIFKNLSYSDAAYHNFLIDSGTKVAGHDYALSVKVKISGAIPKWSIAKNSGTYYCQDEFYYQATETPEDNVVILDICNSNELSDVVIRGSIHYRDVTISNNESSRGWVPADGAYVVPNSQAIGVVDDNGSFTTSPFRAKIGTYARCKLYSNGNLRYVDVKFTNQESETFERIGTDGRVTKVKAYISNMDDLLVNPQGTDRPHLATVISKQSIGPNVRDEILIGDGVLTDITASVATIDPLTGKNYQYTFIDSDGLECVRDEKVTNVQFIVVDPITHEIKSTYEARQNSVDKNIWTFSQSFETGNYIHYKAGDILYARIITDRVPDNFDRTKGTALPYRYGMINTEIFFREEGAKEPPAPIDLDFSIASADANHMYADGNQLFGEEDFGVMALPYIGKLSCLFTAKGMMFGIEKLPNEGIRFKFGKAFKGTSNNFGPDGKPMGDLNTKYDLGWALRISKDMKAIDKQYGTHEALKPVSAGVPTWSIKPYAGVYIDFAPSYDPQGVKRFAFAGGGGFVGVMGDIRYTMYMVIYGIPFYVGGAASMMIMADFGLELTEGNEIIYNDFEQEALNKILTGSRFNFVIRDNVSVSAYVGVGICGTVGVRGGFVLSIDMIYSPMINRIHPNIREWGMSVSGTINIWFDLVLLTIPVPVYSWNFWKTGYFEDISNDGMKPSGSVYSNNPKGLTVQKKVRKSIDSDFVANDTGQDKSLTAEGNKVLGMTKDQLLSASEDTINQTQHVIFSTEENIIINNSYDAAQQKLINYTDPSDNKNKILMLYIDDDESRSDDERTALMYSVYDIETKTWSTPAYVSNDGTADFAPDVYDLGDKIAVVWTSRDTALSGNADDYSRMLSSMDIFYAEFDKETGEIVTESVKQLTDDSYYNTTPKIMYDTESGEMLVAYMASNVPEKFETVEELLKAATPARNDSNIMYKIRHKDGTWENREFYEGELKQGADEKLLLELLDGARFLKSPVSADMQNTIITDLEVTVVNMKSANDSNTTESTGIFAYSVDMDNNLDTSDDKEIFVQTYDFTTHNVSNPIRITNNDIADTLPQIAHCNGEDSLFWLQNGSNIKRIDLTELNMSITGDNKFTGDILSCGANVSSDLNDETEINSFRVYAQESDTCTGSFNYYIAWNETTELVGDRKGEYSQELHVSSYISKMATVSNVSGDKVTTTINHVPSGKWSDNVRMTNNQKINDVPEFAALRDGQNGVMMIGSRYLLNPDETTGGYIISESQLVSMQYKPKGLMTVESVSIDKYPEKVNDRFNIQVNLRNSGLKTVEGFAYAASLWSLGDIQTEGVFSGTYEQDVQPCENVSIGFEATASEAILEKVKDKLLVFMEMDAEGILLNEHVFIADRTARLENFKAVQGENGFNVTGQIRNTTAEKIDSNSRLVVFPNGDFSNKLYNESVTIALEGGEAIKPGETGYVSIEVPAKAELCRYGIQDMAAVVVDENGDACSDYGTFVGGAGIPQITVNGIKHGGTIVLKPGESLELTGDYDPKEFYQGGTVVYAISDQNIASVENGVLTGTRKGAAVLHATVDPFGGDTEIIVKVESSTQPDPDIDTYDGSITSGPLSARRMYGNWVLNSDNTWSFINYGGSRFTGWGVIMNGTKPCYYHFGFNGVMDTGWYYDQTAKTWYYFSERADASNGMMLTGWLQDQKDGKWYYLSEKDGSMLVGWQKIYYKGKMTWFYFNTIHDGYFGACQLSGKTPDGYTLNPDGSWAGF